MKINISKKSVYAAGLGAFALLAGCGQSGMSGTYIDHAGNVSLTFQSGGKVQYHASETGYTRQGTYTVSGKKVTIKNMAPFKIRADGCLESPTLIVCKPKQSS
ncbi:MAG: hypothetical protein ACRES9_04160 [Gammaproteobacteria bacterium]